MPGTDDELEHDRVVLIGMMGSGKSTVGRSLSDRTGWPFVDNDALLLLRATGRTARQLLADEGEEAMRAAESAAMAEGLAMPPPVIVAVAAGTVLDPGNRRALEEAGRVVWLRAEPEVLGQRAEGTDHRPWVQADATAWAQRTLDARERLYASVSDLQVDTGTMSADEAADRILAFLRDG